ncbi:MAG: Smr/MutS family protein, partial [Azospirillaceae bacterium]
APLPAATRRASPPPLSPGRAAGVDRRTADRLRKGRLAVEASLDLHGMTQAAAHGALRRFIGDSHARGRRMVLVVTGKGGPEAPGSRRHGGPPEGRGVLRARVPEWLNAPDLRDKILAIETAQARHGGTGALYVLLKRRREGVV